MARLGDICKLKQGFQVPIEEQIKEYRSGYVRFIRIVDYTQNTSDIRYVKDNKKFYYVKKDDIVMIRYGAAGEVGFGIEGVIANNMFLIEPITKINKKYLIHYLSQDEVKNQLLSKSSSSTMPAINFKTVNDLKIPEHSLGEQEKIVSIFDQFDKVISLRKQQLSKMDELVKSRFIEMFGDPVKNDKGWDCEPMDKVAPSSAWSGNQSDPVWLLNLDMVEAQTGRIIDYLYVTKDQIGNSTCGFDEGNVLYSKLRPYLNKVVVPTKKGYCTTELVPLRPSVNLNRQFLAYLLRSDSFVSFINEKVAGAKMPRVSMNVFREFECILPPIELQNEFSSFVEQVDKSKFEIQKSLEKLETLKKSLMQKYFG